MDKVWRGKHEKVPLWLRGGMQKSLLGQHAAVKKSMLHLILSQMTNSHCIDIEQLNLTKFLILDKSAGQGVEINLSEIIFGIINFVGF